MRQLLLVGGCSKVGKSTIIKEFANKNSLKFSRKLDLVLSVTDNFNISKFGDYEYQAFYKLSNNNTLSPYIIDLHYAIQINRDTNYALFNKSDNIDSEEYMSSTDIRTIKLIANSFILRLVYLYAPLDIIMERRLNYTKENIKMRSLNKEDIMLEIQYEHKFFLDFYDNCCKFNANVQKYELNTLDSISRNITKLEEILRIEK